MADVISKVENVAKEIAHVAHEAEVDVSAAFEKLVGKQNAQDFAHAAAAILKSDAGKLALDVVKGLEAVVPVLSGSAKKAQAFTALSTDLKATEKSLPAALINLLIEVAVAAINGSIVLP